jgi:hypothetical protein
MDSMWIETKCRDCDRLRKCRYSGTLRRWVCRECVPNEMSAKGVRQREVARRAEGRFRRFSEGH